MTRKEAIKSCRESIKELVAESQSTRNEIRQKIRDLKWKPEAATELPRIRAAQKTVASPAQTKELRAALKALRRPETGDERYDLWNAKRRTTTCDRTTFFAYAILRGRTRASMERSPISSDYAKELAFWTLNEIQKHYPDCKWTREDITAWILGEARASLTWEWAA